MKGAGFAVGLVCIVWVIPIITKAQRLVWQDSLEIFDLSRFARPGQSLIMLRVNQKVEYSLTVSGAFFINWGHDPNANQLMLTQDMIYQCLGETEKRFHFSQKVVHHLGFQYLFDSITRFHVDENQFDTRLEWRIRKTHSCFFSSLLSTRLLNGYTFSLYPNDSLVRTLNSSFLTPFTALFAGGLQLNWPSFGSLNVGITSAKLTWIRDKGIFEALGTAIFYGVPQGKRSLFEYGFSLRLLIDHNVGKWLNWNCDLLIFKNTTLPPDISIRNNFGFRLTKFLKARVQTRIFYEERISKKLQLENIVSVGLVVTL